MTTFYSGTPSARSSGRDENGPGRFLFTSSIAISPLRGYVSDTFLTVPLAAGICEVVLCVENVVALVSMLCAQLISFVRVYALYGKRKRLLVALSILCVVQIGIMATFLGLTLLSISHLSDAIIQDSNCYPAIPPIAVFFWVPALVFEPVLCALVLWAAWGEECAHRFRCAIGQSSSPPGNCTDTPDLVKILAQDSLIYFLGIFIELAVNAILWINRSSYIRAALPWSYVLPSILGSRLFLSMREAVLFPESCDRQRGVLRNMMSIGGPSALEWAVSTGEDVGIDP
ncbi:hypothetical protein BD310DRAFT_97233 [Dichomitus squalens]|uniref:Uncharacterized protein n=1 Tax=Dichomitus squalens TaxID=114155 RepID=A0A4Q9PJG5_9APHY|nr:hypothetical protein BD310DRAFT_97233 [Dichomitus squalens]